MAICKHNHSFGLPYGSLIPKILQKDGVGFKGEIVDAIQFCIDLMFPIQIKVQLFQSGLRNSLMEEKEVEAQPIATNKEVINAIFAIFQQNTLVIQVFAKDFDTIKRNTWGKANVKNDDNNVKY